MLKHKSGSLLWIFLYAVRWWKDEVMPQHASNEVEDEVEGDAKKNIQVELNIFKYE